MIITKGSNLLICIRITILLAFNYRFCNGENVENIKIGGLFDSETDDAELVFQYAIEAVNNEYSDDLQRQFEAQTVKLKFGNEFQVSQKLCRLLKSGVAAIFGPTSPTSSLHVRSICDAKEMPHIEGRWYADANLPVINLHPHPKTIEKLYLDLIEAFHWKSFTVIYESAPFLPHVAELLKLYDPKGYTVTVRQLDLNLNGNYRAVLHRIKESDEKHLILDCSIKSLPEILKQAQQVGLLTNHHQLIITNLDLHTLDLEPYQYSGTNITGIRLFDPEDRMMKHVVEFFENSQRAKNLELPEGLTAEKMLVETALTFDAVLLFAEAFRQLKGKHSLEVVPLRCNDSATWTNGYTIINFMKTTSVNGLTRTIKFDHQGHRTDFIADIFELGAAGIERVGSWNATEGLNISRQQDVKLSNIDDGSMKNRSFIVLTALSPPYGMLKDSPEKLSGNDRFEGFGVELIHELSLMLGFNYTFRLQHDGVYGSLDRDTGKWNGMVNELLEWRADLAITDLTITSDRESAVDFTMPFMNLGISILYRKPTKEPPSLFSFMSPFSQQVWLYLGAAYLGVSFCLFVLGRLSPAEWDNPYPCIEEPEVLENQFSLKNSLWFTIGALLQQGSELAPKSPSTRTLASIWWFFTLIMVSSYTANLAAFLTIESISSSINNAEDLANSKTVKYGAKRDGSTISFFKDAEYPIYQKMYEYMMANPDLLTSSNPSGLHRVKTENYAFLMESTSIEYTAERECDVTQIGGLLDDKGYGIAMRKNSPYRSALSEAVLRLQEQGKLTAMKIKWWKEKRGGGACSNVNEDGGALALEVANVGGVFILLMLGGVIAVIANILEMVFDVKRRARDLKISFREELVAELKFFIKCTGTTKVVRHRKSSSNESQNSITSVQSDHSMERQNDSAKKSGGSKEKDRVSRKADLNL